MSFNRILFLTILSINYKYWPRSIRFIDGQISAMREKKLPRKILSISIGFVCDYAWIKSRKQITIWKFVEIIQLEMQRNSAEAVEL